MLRLKRYYRLGSFVRPPYSLLFRSICNRGPHNYNVPAGAFTLCGSPLLLYIMYVSTILYCCYDTKCRLIRGVFISIDRGQQAVISRYYLSSICPPNKEYHYRWHSRRDFQLPLQHRHCVVLYGVRKTCAPLVAKAIGAIKDIG